VELFITNNKLRQLPASMASLTSLVKLQVPLEYTHHPDTVSNFAHLGNVRCFSRTPAWPVLGI